MIRDNWQLFDGVLDFLNYELLPTLLVTFLHYFLLKQKDSFLGQLILNLIQLASLLYTRQGISFAVHLDEVIHLCRKLIFRLPVKLELSGVLARST